MTTLTFAQYFPKAHDPLLQIYATTLQKDDSLSSAHHLDTAFHIIGTAILCDRDEIKHQLKDLKMEQANLKAFTINQNRRLYQKPSRLMDESFIMPPEELFPATTGAFYELQFEENHDKLFSLIQFYNISCDTIWRTGSDYIKYNMRDDLALDHEQPTDRSMLVSAQPELAVTALAEVLGINYAEVFSEYEQWERHKLLQQSKKDQTKRDADESLRNDNKRNHMATVSSDATTSLSDEKGDAGSVAPFINFSTDSGDQLLAKTQEVDSSLGSSNQEL